MVGDDHLTPLPSSKSVLSWMMIGLITLNQIKRFKSSNGHAVPNKNQILEKENTMSDFNADNKNLQTQLTEAQSHYRTINASLQAAKRRGSKADVRELTRSKSRISARLDQIKSKMGNSYSY